jgi:SAM-dependent methyltransferase
MDPYIAANRASWTLLAQEHYTTFKRALGERTSLLGYPQHEELGDLTGKTLIHLQCNTGADTISLARLGARVTGVDLVPENVTYARRLAQEYGVEDARFMEGNVLELMDWHRERYDVVYTTEGVLCWLPDLGLWARNVRHLLKDDGFLYLLDGHPFFMAWDEERLPELVVKYPYFAKTPDKADTIGGYAAEPKQATNYAWMYTVGEIITALSAAGLHVEWFHEFDWLYYKLSAEKQRQDAQGRWQFPELAGQLPFTFRSRRRCGRRGRPRMNANARQ